MAIVSSVIIENSPQNDGRFWSGERHTDQLGLIYEFRSLLDGSANATTVMNNRVVSINADLITREIAANLASVLLDGSLAIIHLNYSTAATNFAALRSLYQFMTRQDAIFAGDFLSSLTSAQLQTAFNLTLAQVTTLRTNKLTPAATAAATIRASMGQ